MNVQDLLCLIPFSRFFFACEKTEQVTIQIFEKFDNDDFGLESIDFLVPNEALQFKSPAQIRVKTALYGVRWFMEEWFFTCALACICAWRCCSIWNYMSSLSVAEISSPS